MIKIREIKEPICYLFDKDNNLIGSISSMIQLDDVRVQIKNEGVGGYYIKWCDYFLPIDKDGRMPVWPEGFYDEHTNLLMELM